MFNSTETKEIQRRALTVLSRSSSGVSRFVLVSVDSRVGDLEILRVYEVQKTIVLYERQKRQLQTLLVQHEVRLRRKGRGRRLRRRSGRRRRRRWRFGVLRRRRTRRPRGSDVAAASRGLGGRGGGHRQRRQERRGGGARVRARRRRFRRPTNSCSRHSLGFARQSLHRVLQQTRHPYSLVRRRGTRDREWSPRSRGRRRRRRRER